MALDRCHLSIFVRDCEGCGLNSKHLADHDFRTDRSRRSIVTSSRRFAELSQLLVRQFDCSRSRHCLASTVIVDLQVADQTLRFSSSEAIG